MNTYVSGVSVDSAWLFFFQAEDGIRDLTVTGVQTCALPIFAGLRRIVQDIREIRERIVVLQIGRRIRTRVSRCGQALRVALPRLSGSYELTYHVVITHRSGEIVVCSDGLPGCQHEIIWNGRMCVGKILGRQTALRNQTV